MVKENIPHRANIFLSQVILKVHNIFLSIFKNQITTCQLLW